MRDSRLLFVVFLVIGGGFILGILGGIPGLLLAEILYLPTASESKELVTVGSTVFSLGTELEVEFFSPKGDEELRFNRGAQGIAHLNESHSRFRAHKALVIPELTIKEMLKLHTELEFSIDRKGAETAFLREAHLSFFSENFLIKIGLDDRFISPEFIAENGAVSDNRMLTSVYPINGTAWWKDEDLGITVGAVYDLSKRSQLYWRGSFSNGLDLDHDEVTRNHIYPILHDDRDVENSVDFTNNKEVGSGIGIRYSGNHFSLNSLGFSYIARLATRDIDFLEDTIPEYSSSKRTKFFTGVNLDLNIFNFNLFSQYIYAKDGLVKRYGYYVQPSFLFILNEYGRFFTTLRCLYRYNNLDVEIRGFESDLPRSPLTWDRVTHTLALNTQVHSYVLWRNEYHFNLEDTGSSLSPSIRNNEFLSQIELIF